MRRFFVLLATAALALAAAVPLAANTVVTTDNGTWNAYPGQSASYAGAVQQPLNVDGSSNFKANGKAVIPVKFALSQGTGAFVFQSIWSDGSSSTYPGTNDFSFLSFRPSSAFTFADLSGLSAVYAFTEGDCAGGSLRWQVRVDVGNDGLTANDGNIFVYYGATPQFGNGGVNGCTPTSAAGDDGSGDNLINTPVTELRYDTSQLVSGTQYNTYAGALAIASTYPVLRAGLYLDSGWADSDGVAGQDDQVVNLTSATVSVGGTSPYTETFTPQPASAMTPICPTDEATISVSKVDGLPSGIVNDLTSIQPKDDDGIFRIVDCKYMYNLATSSLSGVGTYTVSATIGTSKFTVAAFDLR